LVYIAAAQVHHYVENFDRSMKEEFVVNNKGLPNRLWTYIYGQNKWDQKILPDISIREVLTNTKWDIVITCNHTGRRRMWKYEKYKKDYMNYFNLIRECTDAEIYWTYTFVPSRDFNCDKAYEQAYDLVAGSREEMYRYLNKIDDEICQVFGVKPLLLRQAYENLVKMFRNKYYLIMDNIHPDRGVGEYFCSAYLYNIFFKKYYGVDVKDLKFSYNASKYTYSDGTPCISVNRVTKNTVDKIVNLYNE
jgi:hypothetical protein